MPRRPRPTRFDPDRATAAPPLPPERGRRAARGIGRLIVKLLLLAILVPIGLTLLFRFVPPPATVLMVQRAGESGIRKDWRPLDRIDADLVHAVVAAEDSRFCEHSGFDVEAIRKAMEANETSSKVRGGSTISQQTAKNVFLWPQRSWLRKGLEAGFTVLIETLWGKPRIMEVYLNVVEWAPGVYGAEAAAQTWFGKSADSLTRTEAARLAAILPAPRRYKAAPPGPYVRRRAARVARAIQVVRDDGLSACAFGEARRTDGGQETPEPRAPRRPESNRDVLDAARNPLSESEAPVGAPPPPPDLLAPDAGPPRDAAASEPPPAGDEPTPAPPDSATEPEADPPSGGAPPQEPPQPTL